MSAVYFHTEHDKATLRGSERAHMGIFCQDLMLGVIGNLRYAQDWLLPIAQEAGAPLTVFSDTNTALEFWLKDGGAKIMVDGEKIEMWLMGINTALALGNDAVKLMARLHAQCEIHCWIDGPNRAWIADIIERGRAAGVLREGQGWEDVAALLATCDNGPVVCSYSVCESFPNFGALPDDHPLKQRTDDDKYDDFYEIPATEQWRLCMEELRHGGGGLEIKPEDWEDYRFGSKLTVFDLRRSAMRKRTLSRIV